jgi:hypothetical protein
MEDLGTLDRGTTILGSTQRVAPGAPSSSSRAEYDLLSANIWIEILRARSESARIARL